MASRKNNGEGSIRLRADGKYEVRVSGGIDFATGKHIRISKYANNNKKSSLVDSFEGQELTLEFDIENRDGSFKNAKGDVVTSTNTFWFAWYAFHPDGEVYKFKK